MDTKKFVPKKESIWLRDVGHLVSKMPENSRGHFVQVAKVGLNLCIFATLLMLITASSTISAINSCNKGRFVMNSTFGFITNGPENYQEDSYCVWLITGMFLFLTTARPNLSKISFFWFFQHKNLDNTSLSHSTVFKLNVHMIMFLFMTEVLFILR